MNRAVGALLLWAGLAGAFLMADPSGEAPAPASDRVGFPKDYQAKYRLRQSG